MKKKLFVLFALAGFGASVRADAVTVLSVEGRILSYVANAERNDEGAVVLTPGELFVGERIVKEEGFCFRESSTLLKMEKIATADGLEKQIPETLRRREKVSCPA